MRLDLSPFHFLRRFIELRKHLKRTVEKSQIKATDLIGPSLRCQKSEGRKLKHSVEISFSSFLSPSPSCYLFVSSYLSFLFDPLKRWSRFVCHSYLLFILFMQIHCWFKMILPYFLFWKIVTLIETKFKISQKFAVGLILRLSMENVSSWNLDSIKLDIKMELHTFPILSSCKFPACNTLHDIIPEFRGPSRPRLQVGGSLACLTSSWLGYRITGAAEVLLQVAWLLQGS